MGKIERSIEIIKNHEPKEGYHLAFSGGKDSICIYHLAKMAKVKFTPYFYMTTLDPPDVLKFIKKFYPEVKWLKPELSMFQLIEKKGLPIRIGRWCCEYLKEGYGAGEFVMTGVRRSESPKRKTYPIYLKQKDKQILNPIIDWLDADVWRFIRENKLPFPEIYLGCNSRIGCIGCPMNPKRARIDLEKYPRFKNAYLKAIRKRMAQGKMDKFESAEEVLEWWTSGESMINFREKKKQLALDL